jgi:hypothetical protein
MSGFRWQDWDGSSNEWRAIDVERAIFALGPIANTSQKLPSL